MPSTQVTQKTVTAPDTTLGKAAGVLMGAEDEDAPTFTWSQTGLPDPELLEQQYGKGVPLVKYDKKDTDEKGDDIQYEAYGVDVDKMVSRRADSSFDSWMAEEAQKNRTISSDERDAKKDELQQKAYRSVTREIAMVKNPSMAFIDTDPLSTTEDLVKLGQITDDLPMPAWAGYPSRNIARIGAWMDPYNADAWTPVVDPETGETSMSSLQVADQSGVWDWAMWAANGAPTTIVGSALYHDEEKAEAKLKAQGIAAPTQEQIAEEALRNSIQGIREGESIFEPEYLKELGEWFVPDMLEEAGEATGEALGMAQLTPAEKDFWYMATGLLPAFALSVVEPDAISVMTGGAGKVYKVGKGAMAGGSAVYAAYRASKALGEEGLAPIAARTQKAVDDVGTTAMPSDAGYLGVAVRANVMEEAADDIAKLHAAADTPIGQAEVLAQVAKSQATLRKIDPALAEQQEILFAAQMGSNVPISVATSVLRKAVDAKVAAKDELLRAAGVTTEAADEVAANSLLKSGKAKKWAWSRMKVSDDPALASRLVEAEDDIMREGILHAESQISDLTMWKQMMQSFGLGRGTAKVTDAADDVSADALRKAWDRVVKAQQGLGRAAGDTAVEAATKSLREAEVLWNATIRKVGKQAGPKAYKALDMMIEATTGHKAALEARRIAHYKAAKKRKGLPLGRVAVVGRVLVPQGRKVKGVMAKGLNPAVDTGLESAQKALKKGGFQTLKRVKATKAGGEEVLKAVDATEHAIIRGTMATDLYVSNLRNTARSLRKVSKVMAQGGPRKTVDANKLFKPVLSVADPKKQYDMLVQAFGREVVEDFIDDGGVWGARLAGHKAGIDIVADEADMSSLIRALEAYNVATRAMREGTLLGNQALAMSKELGRSGAMQRLMHGLEKTWNNFFNTAKAKYGKMAPEATQVIKGALDSEVVLSNDIGDILRSRPVHKAKPFSKLTDEQIAANRMAKVAALRDYLTSGKPYKFSASRETVVNHAGGVALWAESFSYLRNLSKASKAAQGNILDGLSRVWLPSTVKKPTGAKKLRKALDNILAHGSYLPLKESLKGLKGKKREARKLQLLEKAKEQSLDDVMDQLRTATVAYVPQASNARVASEELTAWAMAAHQLGAAALLYRAQDDFVRLTSPVTPDVADAFARMTSGSYKNIDPKALEKLLQVFDSVGIPATLAKQAKDDSRIFFMGLEALGKGMDGESSVMPRRWMDAMDERLGKTVKEFETYNMGKLDDDYAARGVAILSRMMRLWRVGLTTGAILPRPRYFANMVVGNFAQVMAEEGLYQAFANTSTVLTDWASLAVRSDFMPESMQKMFRGKKMANGDTSPNALNGLFNSYVDAVFDPAKAPHAKKIRLKSGEVITFGQLRKQMLREGVLSTFASSSIGKGIRKAEGLSESSRLEDKALGFIEDRAQMNADLADMLEQRQRVALYTDMVINRGLTPSQAGKAVRNTLYDWGHAADSRVEQMLGKVVLFYRFWKLALGQGSRVLFDGVTAGVKGEARAASVGEAMRLGVKANSMANVRLLTNMTRGAQALMGTSDYNWWDVSNPWSDLEGELAESDDPYRNVLPWFYDSSGRAHMGAQKLPPTEASRLLATRGVTATHRATSIPAFTTVDTVGMMMAMVSELARAAHPNQDADFRDLGKRAGKSFSSHMSQPMEKAFNGFMGYMLQDEMMFPSRGTKLRRPTDRMLGEKLGLTFQDPGGDAPDTGATVRVDSAYYNIYRLLPVLGTDLAYWSDPLLSEPVQTQRERGGPNQSDMETYGKVLTYVMRQYLGIMSENVYSPEEVLENRGTWQVKQGEYRTRLKERRNYDHGVGWRNETEDVSEQE